MKRISAVLAMTLMTIVAAAGTAVAGEPTSTWFSAVATTEGTIEAIANVCHASNEDCGNPTGDIKFKLLKRKDGAWVKLATHVSSRDEGWFATFKAPRRGKCKIVARYLGDDTYDPSKATIKSTCRDDWWIG